MLLAQRATHIGANRWDLRLYAGKPKEQNNTRNLQTMHIVPFSLSIVCIPISLLWVLMGKLLSFIGQDPEISLEAGKYAMHMIPGLFAFAIAQPMMKFLQSQSLIFPMVLSSILTLCLHIPLCWVLVFKSGLGNIGAAVSISISYWLNGGYTCIVHQVLEIL